MHMLAHKNNSRVSLEETQWLLLDIMAAHPPLDLLTSLYAQYIVVLNFLKSASLLGHYVHGIRPHLYSECPRLHRNRR